MELFGLKEGEKWRPVLGNEGRYEISNYGTIRNIKTGYILRQFLSTKHYLQVRIMFDDGEKTRRIHRLVAEAWILNPYNYPQVNHLDGNKKNNYVENLEWCTNTQNTEHYKRDGGWNSVLSRNDVISIYKRWSMGELQKNLAKEYSVSKATICLLCNAKTWSHVTNKITI